MVGEEKKLRSHDEYKGMTVAHALNALGTVEDREIKDHLSTCAECRVEFDSWKETASSLAFGAESAMPSPNVRTRIVQQARELSSTASGRQVELSETISDESAKTPSNLVPMRKPMRRTWNSGEMSGAIAASLVSVLLLGTVIVLWQRNRAMESDLARVSRQVDESQKEIARVREDKGLLTAPESRMASLTGTEMAKDARAMIAYNRITGRAMLVANGLPPAPEGQAYQLWFIPKGKQPMPGAVFATDAAGHAEMRDVVPPEGREAATFAVTLERAGGVPVPQGKIYLQSSPS